MPSAGPIVLHIGEPSARMRLHRVGSGLGQPDADALWRWFGYGLERRPGKAFISVVVLT
jgi:hypothetical protein